MSATAAPWQCMESGEQSNVETSYVKSASANSLEIQPLGEPPAPAFLARAAVGRAWRFQIQASMPRSTSAARAEGLAMAVTVPPPRAAPSELALPALLLLYPPTMAMEESEGMEGVDGVAATLPRAASSASACSPDGGQASLSASLRSARPWGTPGWACSAGSAGAARARA